MAMSVPSETTFFSMKMQSAICPQLRTGSSGKDRGRIDNEDILWIAISILKNVVSEETVIAIMFSGIDYILGQKLML